MRESVTPGTRHHLIDSAVGVRLNMRRRELGLSQSELGDAMGVTFQQIQKYEKGVNRLSASKLWDAAVVLDVPVGYFFVDVVEKSGVVVAEMPVPLAPSKITIALVQDYNAINHHPEIQMRFRNLLSETARVLAAEPTASPVAADADVTEPTAAAG